MLRLIFLLFLGILTKNIEAEPLISDDTAGLLEDDELGPMVCILATFGAKFEMRHFWCFV